MWLHYLFIKIRDSSEGFAVEDMEVESVSASSDNETGTSIDIILIWPFMSTLYNNDESVWLHIIINDTRIFFMCGDKRFLRLKAFQKKCSKFSFRIKNLIKSNYYCFFFSLEWIWNLKWLFRWKIHDLFYEFVSETKYAFNSAWIQTTCQHRFTWQV